MKKAITLFSLSIGLLITTSLQAKIWRVNNTGVAADFITAQDAHDDPSFVNGDTIHVEASGSSYGNLYASKKLVLIGSGYFLAQNSNLQANVSPAILGYLWLDPGSEGSVVTGMTMDYANLRTSNIVFLRNYVTYSCDVSAAASPTSNITIAQCYIGNYAISGSGSYPVSNISISNSIIQGSIYLSSNCSGVIENNVILSYLQAYNFTVRNNIFLGGGGITATGGSIVYNLSDCGSCLPSGNGNQNGIIPTDVFVLSGSTDAMYQLKTGSIAFGAGQGGIDCGAFGGADPYRLSGVPAVPSIYNLSVPLNSNGNQLPITISVRSNN